MKEIIRFTGRGFLTIAVAVGMLAVIYSGIQNRNISGSIKKDRSMEYFELDVAYMESKTINDLTLEWIFEGSVPKQMYIDPDFFIEATDKEGTPVEVELLGIGEESMGKTVQCTDGVYTFSSSGIYRMYVKCRDRIFWVRFPVNVVEEQE